MWKLPQSVSPHPWPFQELAFRAVVLHCEQLHRVPLGGRVRLHADGALHRPLHRHRLPAQAKNVKGD